MKLTHEIACTAAELASLRDVAMAMPRVQQVDLGLGETRSQGLSPRCAAEAICNIVEHAREKYGGSKFPVVRPALLYSEARAISGMPPAVQGVPLWSAAEAYCRLVNNNTRWMSLPLDPEVIAQWLLVEGTGVAYAMGWNKSDEAAASNKVLLAPAGGGGEPHAVSIHGYDLSHPYKTRWYQRRKQRPVFAIENSNNPVTPEWFLPMADIKARGYDAIVITRR